MNKSVLIAPSLLSCDFGRIKEEIQKIEDTSADILHLDVMDGHFVPNLTFGIPVIQAIKKYSHLDLDVHLMVENPQDYIEPLAGLQVKYCSFHTECTYHGDRLIHQIKEKNMKAGIVLNPATHHSALEYIADVIDFVLVMTVNPGFGGQKFITSGLEKIEHINQMRSKQNYSFLIEVDGGVTDKNAKQLVERGADILVAGSYIFSGSSYEERVRSLKNVF